MRSTFDGCIVARTFLGRLKKATHIVAGRHQAFDPVEIECWPIVGVAHSVVVMFPLSESPLGCPVPDVVAPAMQSSTQPVVRDLPIASLVSCLLSTLESMSIRSFKLDTYGSSFEQCGFVFFSVRQDLRSWSSPRWDSHWH